MNKFYACSVGEPGKDYDKENLERIIHENAFVLHKDAVQKGVYDEISVNDILLLKYRNLFIAYGNCKGKKQSDEEEWNLLAPVDRWFFKEENNPEAGVTSYGIGEGTIGGGQYGTVKELKPQFALKKIHDINYNTDLYRTISKDIIEYMEKSRNQAIIDVLKYKKQIILQGPPGTGKTRMAKLIAEELTKPKNVGSPVQQIDNFFKTFDSSKQNVQIKRQEMSELLNTFHQKFPKDKIASIRLEDYCIGTGLNDSFCWWIERGLKPLGYYFPGTARSYLLYWSKSKDDYSKHGKLLEGITNNESAIKKVASLISNFVETKDFIVANKFLGESFLLKLLHSYYPEEYAPINGVSSLNNALKLFGIDYSQMNPVEKNLKLQEIFKKKKAEFKTDITNLEFMRFLFESFDLKGNILVESDEVISKGEYKVIQFHPAYSYEDFVRGITAKANLDNQIEYIVENRILSQFAEKALENKSANFVLIIDEINRANLPAVLGELIYALEYRFDEINPKETTVESLYALKNEDEPEKEESKELRLPQNLFIIGTMNTADRSVGHIDYAIRRRFAFADILPSKTPIHPIAENLFKSVSELFIKNYDTIDWDKPVFERSDFIASDFRPEDVWVGHSYFISLKETNDEAKAELQVKLDFEIKPLLKEYLKDGLLLATAEEKINSLHV